jgi:hypothetical protein
MLTLRTGNIAFLTLCFAAGLVSSGCTTVWTKPGITEQGFATDSYECERDVRQGGYYGSGLAGSLAMRDFYERCMMARGYQKTTAKD